jgi:ABC-type transporter Mla subunit MlaD
MSFFWDPEKRLEANLATAAQAFVNGMDDLHNTFSMAANALQGIRDNLENIKTSLTAYPTVASQLSSVSDGLTRIGEHVEAATERTVKLAAYDSMRNENLELMKLNGELLRRLNEAERKLYALPPEAFKLQHPGEAEGSNGELSARLEGVTQAAGGSDS